MPAIILGVEFARPWPPLTRTFASLKKEVLADTAATWHREILPQHFTGRNRSRYQHTPRTQWYIQNIKAETGQGKGRFMDLVLSGKSERFLKAFHKITATSRMATLRMQGPTYFAKPFIGTYTVQRRRGDKMVSVTKRITHQPDKPGELTRTDTRDREALATRAALLFEKLVAQTDTKAIKISI